MSALSYYASNADDPYLSKNEVDSDEENEAEIKDDDNVIAVTRVRDEHYGLEAWVYNEREKYIYCHHDYILSSCPIASELVGFGLDGSSSENFIAVGSVDPGIELWNLDLMNNIEPHSVLSGNKRKKVKKLEKKKRKSESNGHTDAVLDLSWNKLLPHVLASASADSCVGIWDLDRSSCVVVNSLYSDKVNAVQWHPFESQMLLSGSLDHHVKLIDCQSPNGCQKSWKLSGEVEKVQWNAHNAYNFFASTENGHVYCYDIRADKPQFKLKAHRSAVTALTLSPAIEGCLITSSEDQSVKVWDIRTNEPQLVEQKKCKLGAVFCTDACPDSRLLLCVGGEREFHIVDMKNSEKIIAGFGSDRVPETAKSEAAENVTINVNKKKKKKAVKQKIS